MKDRKFKSREILIEESLNEFGEFSYENASLNGIMKRASVSKGSFYYHFKNKEDLYQQCLTESVNAKWTFISEFTKAHGISFKEMDIFDKFLLQAKAGILFSEENPKYNRLASMFSKEKGNPIYDKMIDIVGGHSTDILKSMIREAYDMGELDGNFEFGFVEHLLESLFINYDEIVGYRETGRNLEDLEAFVRFLKNGIGAK